MKHARDALPDLAAAVAWTVFAGALVVAGGVEPQVALAGTVPPALLGAWGAWAGLRLPRHDAAREPGASSWLRVAAVIGLVVVLIPLGAGLAETGVAAVLGQASIQRIQPGVGEAWAYALAVGLTLAAVLPHGGGAARVAAAFGLLELAALVLVVVSIGGALGGDTGIGRARCDGALAIPTAGRFQATASGELDRESLGRVAVDWAPDGHVTVHAVTRWHEGTVGLSGEDPAGLAILGRTTLSSEERLTAEDLGIDRVAGTPARHCRLVIDGRSAVAGFMALRWLVGADERTTDPGAGLEAWRGTLDYWVRPSTAAEGDTLVLASVSVDGQPPGWPFPGLRATVRAAILWLSVP